MTPPEKAANARKVTDLTTAQAEELRAEAARQRISNVLLQRRTHIAKNTLGEIMAGTKPPDTSQLDVICKALDISIFELFERTERRMVAERKVRLREVSGD